MRFTTSKETGNPNSDICSAFSEGLTIIIKEGNISEIIKVYNGGDEILDSFKNKKVSADEVLLSKRDFERFKKIYYRMKSRKDYRREAIIEAYSILLSYEYYQASVLEDCRDVTREEIFRDLCII